MLSLENIRKQIDILDDAIISLLEKRLSLVAMIKKEKGAITDKDRENTILQKIASQDIQEIYKTIFLVSKKIQKENLYP